MPEQSAGAQLHLSDFSIKGFFGLEGVSIPCLGRVTLLVGRNSVGKTTVLDAVQIYAARGRPTTVEQILGRREELAVGLDEDQDPVAVSDVKALFFGRGAKQVSTVSIGPADDALTFEFCARKALSSNQQKLFDEFPIYSDSEVQLLKSVFRHKERLLPWMPAVDDPARYAEGIIIYIALRIGEGFSAASTRTNGRPKSSANRWVLGYWKIRRLPVFGTMWPLQDTRNS